MVIVIVGMVRAAPGRAPQTSAHQKGDRMKVKVNRNELTGPRGLVVAIIAQAYQDAHSSPPSLAHPARQWFKTQDFKNYLRWLDIPETARPQLQEDQTVTTKPHDVGDILVSIVNQIAKRDGVDFNRAYATLAQERPDVLQTYTDARRTEEDIERLKKVITR